MTRKEFINAVATDVANYAKYDISPRRNVQLRVNPQTLEVMLERGENMLEELDLADENIEISAAADRQELDDGAQNQVEQTPDFYSVESLLKEGKPDMKAIEAVADCYFD